MSERQLICISNGTPQMEYVGTTDMTEGEIDELIKAGGMLELQDCRCLRILLIPQATAVQQEILATPISISRSAVRCKLRPLAYWWPSEAGDATITALNKQIQICEQSEVAHRLQDAGFVAGGSDGNMRSRR